MSETVVEDYLHPDQVIACPRCRVEAEFKNLDEGTEVELQDGSKVIDYRVKCPKCGIVFVIRSIP